MPKNTSHTIANVIDLISEGPIEGFPTSNMYKHIYLDDTPVSMTAGDYSKEDLNFQYKLGTSNQTAFTGAYGTIGQVIPFASTNVLRAEETYSGDMDKTSVGDPGYGYGSGAPETFTTCAVQIRSDTDASSINLVDNIGVTVSWPEGLYRTDSNEGVIKSQDSRLEISICPNPSASDTNRVWIVRVGRIPGALPISQNADRRWSQEMRDGGVLVDNSFEARQYTYRLQLPPNWLTKGGGGVAEQTILVKLTCIYGYSSKLVHSSIQPVSVTTYLKNNQNYPYSALAALTINSDEFSSVPKRGYELKLLKVQVPSNYYITTDPVSGEVTERKYIGVWDGTFKTQWSDNPAWTYYDLITNKRYGLGKYVDPSLVDKWELYKIAQYCDGVVTTADNWDIYFQRYDSAGVAQGSNTTANTTQPIGVQIFPKAIELSNGNTLIVWNNYNTTNKTYNPVGKIYTSAGVVVVSDFDITTSSATESILATDIVAISGSFVVAMRAQQVIQGVEQKEIYRIYGRPFTNAGVASSTFLVERISALSNNSLASFSNPTISPAGTGYVVGYAAFSNNDYNCYNKIYTNTHTVSVPLFTVNTTTIGTQTDPRIATLTGGNYIVVYTSNSLVPEARTKILGQIYTSAGVKVGTELTIASSTTYNYTTPSVASISTGGFTVAYKRSSVSVYADFLEDETAIVSKVFSSTGTEVVGETLVSTLSLADDIISYHYPNIIGLSGGGYVITWSSYVAPAVGSAHWDVYIQRYNSSNVAQGSNTLVHSASTGNEAFSSAYKIGTGFGITFSKLGSASTSNIKLFRARNGGENKVGEPVGGVPRSYSTTLPDTEPRYTCNILINNREEAYNLIRTMASIFRGITYFQQNTLVTKQDAPQDPSNPTSVVPDLIFNNTNVIDGTFEYSSTALKARHSVALVSYVDALDMYKDKVEYVEFRDAIDRYGYRPLEIRAAGCTSSSQAHRVGLWSLITENIETDTVTFTTGLEGSIVYPGAIICIRDSNRSTTRKGGRVVSSTNNTITVDAPITITTVTNQKLYVQSNVNQTETLPDGSTRQTIRPTILIKDVNNVTNSNVITLTSGTWGNNPPTGAVWFLSDDSDPDRFFRVISVEQTNFNTYSVTGLVFNPNKYTTVDSGEYLQIPTVPISTKKPRPPTSVTLSHDYVASKNGGYEVYLKISWTPHPLATSNQGYIVALKSESNNVDNVLTGEYSRSYLPDVYYGTNTATLKLKWNKDTIQNYWQAKVIPTDIYGKTPGDITKLTGMESDFYKVRVLMMPPLITSSQKDQVSVLTISKNNSISVRVGDGDEDILDKYSWEIWAKNSTLNGNTLSTTIASYPIGAIEDNIVTLTGFNSTSFKAASHYADMEDPLSDIGLDETKKLKQYRVELNLGEVTGTTGAGTSTTQIVNTSFNFKAIPVGACVTANGYVSYVVGRTGYNTSTNALNTLLISPAIPGLTTGASYSIKEAIYSSPIVGFPVGTTNKVKLNNCFLLTTGVTVSIKLYYASIINPGFRPAVEHTGLKPYTTYRYWVRARSESLVTDWLPTSSGVADTTGVASDSQPAYVPAVNNNPFFVSRVGSNTYPSFWFRSRTITALSYVTTASPWELKITSGEAVNSAFKIASTKYIIYVRIKSSAAETGTWQLIMHEKDSALSQDKVGICGLATTNNANPLEIGTRDILLSENGSVVTSQSISSTYTLRAYTYTPTSTAQYASIGIYRSGFVSGTDIYVDSCLVGDELAAGSPVGTYVAGQLAESVAGVTVNYNTSNDNNTSPILIPVTGSTITATKNKDSTYSVNLKWEWLGYPPTLDGFTLYFWSSGSAADDATVVGDSDYVKAQTGYAVPRNLGTAITGCTVTNATAGLTATLTAGVATATLASTTGLVRGQKVTKTAGTGVFGSGSGLQLNIVTRNGELRRISGIPNGGTRYNVGDIVTVPGGTGGTVRITATDGTTGVVTGVIVHNTGSGYSDASGVSITTISYSAGPYITDINTGTNQITLSVNHATSGAITFTAEQAVTATTSVKGLSVGDPIRIQAVGGLTNLNNTSTTATVTGTNHYIITYIGTGVVAFDPTLTISGTYTSGGRLVPCKYNYTVNNITANYFFNAWAQPYRSVNTTISENGVIAGDVRMIYNG
jgi:hypothetical protein